MTEIQLTILANIVILIVNGTIALLGYFKIYRHRVIYSIDTEVLRMPTGALGDKHISTEGINKRLRTGEYTVLQVVERRDRELEIILGQIKESKKS
jgi:hypothetical protein